MINTARVEIRDTANLHAILVWDEKPSGDGPGGTADFAARVRGLGGLLRIVNPTSLYVHHIGVSARSIDAWRL